MNELLASTTSNEVTLEDFGKDPLWLVILKVLVIFVALLLLTLFTTWYERRVVAKMQNRPGPNRAGPFGLLQPIADGIKLALKQGITPVNADIAVYLLAPIIAATAAMMIFAVVPMGPMVSIFGTETPLQLTDFSVSVLYVLAIASVGIYGIVLAGWSSGSTYSLLGGLRSSAQMISYEIAMGLSFVAVFLWAGTMSTSQIVNAQSGWWYAILLAPSFIIYAISMVGETNRAPFDLPEAEGELVAGFHTEYSGLRWAMFFLAEYINMINVSAIAATLFLGGWRMPAPISTIWPGSNEGWWPLLWFFGKVFVFLFVFIWLRGTLPRLRYDQFMRFGWKVLIPLSILWILVIATLKGIQNEYKTDLKATMLWIALILLVLAALAFVFDVRRGAREVEEDAPDFDAFAGGYPVPPLPGQELTVTRRAKATVAGTAVSSTVDVAADTQTEGEETPHE
ncbi:MAG: NADH-quinone oxidoreductase subunit NuoH [Candidatus Nanopelagicales bacterium]